MTRPRHRPAFDVRLEIRSELPARRRIARRTAVPLARRTPGREAHELLALERWFHLAWTPAPDGTARSTTARRLRLTRRPFVCHTGPEDGRARVLHAATTATTA